MSMDTLGGEVCDHSSVCIFTSAFKPSQKLGGILVFMSKMVSSFLLAWESDANFSLLPPTLYVLGGKQECRQTTVTCEARWEEISQLLNLMSWLQDPFPPLCLLWQWHWSRCASWESSHLPPPPRLGIWTKIPGVCTTTQLWQWFTGACLSWNYSVDHITTGMHVMI